VKNHEFYSIVCILYYTIVFAFKSLVVVDQKHSGKHHLFLPDLAD